MVSLFCDNQGSSVSLLAWVQFVDSIDDIITDVPLSLSAHTHLFVLPIPSSSRSHFLVTQHSLLHSILSGLAPPSSRRDDAPVSHVPPPSHLGCILKFSPGFLAFHLLGGAVNSGSRIILETPDFKPFLLVSRLESEISRIIAKVCHFL